MAERTSEVADFRSYSNRSLSYMKRPVQYALASIGSALLFVCWHPVASQPAGKLPTVDNATHKAYLETLTRDVSFEMLPIPGGTFIMGSPASEKGRKPDEGPQHPVAIKPFWMG